MSEGFPSAPARRPFRTFVGRLAERWPELLVEVVSIVGAVLLAFAVDAWRAERNQRLESETLRAAVLAEMQANREELARSQASLSKALAQIRSLVNAASEGSELELGFNLALLSSAAYDVMQGSSAAASIELDWRIRAARAYELQELVQDRQARVVNALGRLAKLPPDSSPQSIARELDWEISTTLQLRSDLTTTLEEFDADR